MTSAQAPCRLGVEAGQRARAEPPGGPRLLDIILGQDDRRSTMTFKAVRRFGRSELLGGHRVTLHGDRSSVRSRA